MNRALFSPLLYVNLLPSALLLLSFCFFHFGTGWCAIPQGSSLHCVYLALEDWGGHRERCDSCMTPSFFAGAAVKWRCFQKSHFSIFDHGYYSCVRNVNLHHLMFLLSPNRIGWDGVVFVSNLSTLWHLQRIFFHRSYATSQHLSTRLPRSNTNSNRPTWPSFRCISNPLHCGVCLFVL